MQRAAALLAVLILTAPSHAGETAWQEVAPGVSIRMIGTGQVKADGTTLVGVEIDMPQNTKTYWRVPGDTGFPAEFNFTGPSVTGHQVLWPYPTRDVQDDYLDYAYFGPTVLPMQLQVTGTAPVADLSLVLGICSDICVPAQASFTLPLADASPDRANGLRLRQAVAMTPVPWNEPEQPIGVVRFQPEQDAIAVEVSDPGFNISSLIAATPSGEPAFGTPQKSREPNLVLIPVLGRTEASILDGQPIELTFMTETGAFAVSRTIEAGE